MIDMTPGQAARKIAEERGISMSRAYRIAAEQRKNGQIEDPDVKFIWTSTFSKKDSLLEALYKINANAGIGPESLIVRMKSMGTPIPMHEAIRLCWDLQKQEMIAFKEGHEGYLHRIRLTLKGRTYILGKMRARDRKERKNGAVEIIHEASHPEVVPATPYAPPVPEPLGDPLPQNMKAPLDEPTEMLLDPVHADAEPLVNKIDFPLITDLINRADAKQKAKEKAAKMVEAASMISDIDDDASEFLMTRAAGIEGPALSRLELEVLRLLEHL